MHWFNGFGLVFMLVIMVPNVVFAIRCQDGFENKWKNKPGELMEQIGRFGCFGFMVFSSPGGLLQEKQRLSRACALHSPLGSVSVQRHHEPLRAAGCIGASLCDEHFRHTRFAKKGDPL